MRFVSLSVLAIAALSVVALPTAEQVDAVDVNFNQTVAAAVPTIAEIKKHFNVASLPSKALFWSSAGAAGNWQDLSNKYAKTDKRLTLDLMWKDDWYKQYINPKTHTEAEIRAFWNEASKAMATISSGVPYVLLPTGREPAATSTWVKVEYPQLIQQSSVKKICRVNYDAATQYSKPYMIWPKLDKFKC